MKYATSANVVRETEKAYLITVNGRRFAGSTTFYPSENIWVPKSQASIHSDDLGLSSHVAVPGWLMKKINSDFRAKTGAYITWYPLDEVLEDLSA